MEIDWDEVRRVEEKHPQDWTKEDLELLDAAWSYYDYDEPVIRQGKRAANSKMGVSGRSIFTIVDTIRKKGEK